MIQRQPKYVLMAGAFAALVATGTAQAQTVQTTHVVKTVTVTTEAPAAVENMPNSQMQALLNAYMRLKPKPVEILNAEQARKQPTMADAVKELLKERGERMPGMHGIEKDSAHYRNEYGDHMPVKVYYTRMHGEEAKSRPVILYFHGGGWVIANVKTYEASIIALARKTGAIVIAPEYRMAPEDKFPAAHEDAFAAYQWTIAHAKQYGGDPSRIAVVGESAGGNLAANVGIMARDRGVLLPVALGLIYPVAGTDMSTPSYLQNVGTMPLSREMMGWFMSNISAPEHRVEVMHDTRLDLIHANLNGLPPTTVITAGIDPLRSDGEMLVTKLQAAGVSTSYRNYEGVTHEFFGAGAVLDDAVNAQDYMANQMKASLYGK